MYENLSHKFVDGDLGSWYSSSPGNGIDAISVASIDKYVFYDESVASIA